MPNSLRQTRGGSVTDIERAFTQGYGSSASLGSSQQMFANARDRWQTSVAGFQDALMTQATVVGNLTGTRAEIEALMRPGRPTAAPEHADAKTDPYAASEIRTSPPAASIASWTMRRIPLRNSRVSFVTTAPGTGAAAS
jgi:hypothetical protein